MKRSTGSKRVVRAIALALATVITATSMPVTTLAEEEQKQEEITVENLTSSGGAVDEADKAVDDAKTAEGSASSEKHPITITIDNKETNTKDALNEKFDVNITDEGAKESHDNYNKKNNISGGNNVKGYLEEGDALIEAVKQELLTIQNNGYGTAEANAETATGNIEDAVKADYIADLEVVLDGDKPKTVDTVDMTGAVYDEDGKTLLYVLPVDENGNPAFDENGGITVYVPEVVNGVTVYGVMKLVYKNSFDQKAGSTKQAINETAENIDKANNSNDEKEAREAAANVEPSKENVEGKSGEFAKMDAAIQKAQSALNQADTDLQKARNEFDSAVGAAEEAQKNALSGAVKDTAAASAVISAAKERVDKVKAEADKAYEARSNAELELLRTLYESFKAATYDKDKWLRADELCKALIRYNITDEASQANDKIENFRISGGIDGIDASVLSKDLFGYTKTVGDDFEVQEIDGVKRYVRISHDYEFSGTSGAKKGEINYGYKWNKVNDADGNRVESGWVESPAINGVAHANNVVVVKYTKNGEEVERYFNCKIENGDLVFYERNITVEDIDGTAHAGQDEESDFYKDGKTEENKYGDDFDSENSKLKEAVVKKADGTVDPDAKMIAHLDDERKDGNTNTESDYAGNVDAFNKGNGTKYTEVSSRSEYEKGTTYVINKEGKGSETFTDKNIDNSSNNASYNKLKSELDSVLEEYGEKGEDGKDYVKAGYKVYIEYSTLAQGTKVIDISNFDKKPEDFWGKIEQKLVDIDNGLADFFNTASYKVVVSHTADEQPGAVENVYKTYEKETASTDSEPIITKEPELNGLKLKEGGKTKAKTAVDDRVNALVNNEGYVRVSEDGSFPVKLQKTLDDGTVKTYSLDIEKGSMITGVADRIIDSIVKICGGSTDELHKWKVKVSCTTVTKETLADQLVATNHFGGTEYNKVITQEKIEAATENLQTVVWESDADARVAHGVKNTQVAKEYKDFYDAYQRLVGAQSAVETAETKVGELETQINTLNQKGLTAADSSSLDNLSKMLGNAKIAHKVALQYRDYLAGLYAPLTDIVINLSRFDPVRKDDDDDDGDDDTPSAGGSPAGSYTLPSGITVVPLTTTTPSGVAGVRTGRTVARKSGVAGVRVENDAADDTKQSTVVAGKTDDTKDPADKSTDSSSKQLTKVETPETPLASTPFEEGMNMNLLWLLLAAAAIIAGVVVYENHRKKVAANDEVKKYKK